MSDVSHPVQPALSDAPRRTCGRPPVLGECERRERILDAADIALQTYGYQNTSMDRIAQCSCMSKKTLYQMFDSKQVLFETLLKERLLVTELHGLTLLGDTVEEQLIYGVSCFADTLLEEKRVNLMRVIITEVSRQPEIGAFVRELFASSSKPHPLRKWLKDFSDQGKIRLNNLDDDTDILFGMTVGTIFLCELTHCRPSKTPTEKKAFISSAVRIFLRGLNTL
ncbi:TetR/AcrR family transcriptional regulator [Kozakia baliensis]|uniref:TetR/AcrR family transcriptional regulator n=1 Tax=Kozakia baliensis TaxID=153496 RepID=UPI00345C61B7